MGVRSPSGSLVLAALYSGLLWHFYGTVEGGFGSLPEVVELFRHPAMVLIGWVLGIAMQIVAGTIARVRR